MLASIVLSIVYRHQSRLFHNTMKLFQCVQRFYHTMGLLPLQSIDNFTNFKLVRILLSLFSLISLVFSEMGYFLFEAKTTIEYIQTFIMSFIGLACIVNFLIQLWKIANICQLIEQFDAFIEKSKLHS